VGKFIKTVTYQRLTPQASRAIAPVMARMCEAEGMLAHAATCDVRFSRYAPPNSVTSKVTKTEGAE
jgi:sulfopropanediol 3-dehydrogenase